MGFPSQFKLEAMANNGDSFASRLSLIVVLWCTRCNKDLLYIFDIANSHGRIGEQVRGDIENGLFKDYV